MEHFAWDHAVLQHFSEHETSGEGLPLDLFNEMYVETNNRQPSTTATAHLLVKFETL